jgi:diguanylate cyclase (GGDEF)-like protein
MIVCGRDQDTVARWGGDEFIILLPDIDKPHDAVSVAEKILQAFDQPVIMPNHELTISLSVGISIFPEGGTDADTLIKNADSAMYHAKNKGRNHYHLFASGDPQ